MLFISTFSFLLFLHTVSCTVADWDSMGCVVIQTHNRAFQTLGRSLYFLGRLQNLARVFEKLGPAFERLSHAC